MYWPMVNYSKLDFAGDLETYTALKDTEPALKDIHDGVVEPFPFVNHIVIMDDGHEISGGVIFSKVLQPLFFLFRVIPATFEALCFLVGENLSQKFDMAG